MPIPSVFLRSSRRLLLAATILLLLPVGCYRTRMLKPKHCPPGDPSCTSVPGRADASSDGPRDADGDRKRDGAGGSGGTKRDGPLDGIRDSGGGRGDGAGGIRGDGPADGKQDLPSDRGRDGRADGKRDAFVCGPVEICANASDDDCNGFADCYDRACFGDPSCIGRKKETCDNGIDDDGNGLVDCRDPACFGDKACAVPGKEICNNNLDDDGDGLVDCNDTDCTADPSCKVTPGEEICDNGKDDNGDGLVDCTDPKCKSFAACLQAACVSDIDFGAIASSGAKVTRTMATSGATASYTTCAPPGGGARVGSFSLAVPADVKLDFSQSTGMAHVVALFRAGVGQTCDQNPVDCLMVGDEPTATQTYTALPPGSYWLVVQSYPGTTGSTQVTLSTGTPGTTEICNNGIDDDGDGARDCADLDCASSSNCNRCVPDINLGTLVVGGGSKSTTVDTSQGQNRYHPSEAGLSTGNDIVVQFSVRETVVVTLQTWQTSGQHAYGLFPVPPAGAACDDDEHGGSLLGSDTYQNMTWSFFPPGDYLLIYKALAPGQEGTLSITLTAYANRGVEICDNDIDDDGDRQVDCDDPDCASLPICTAPVCAPDGDLGDIDIGTRVSVEVDVTTATMVYRSKCGRGDGRGRAYRVNLLTPMNLSFSCSQTGDHVFQLVPQTGPLDACDAHLDNCVDPSRNGCSFSMPSVQPGIYYLLVEAFASGEEGAMNLTLRGTPATVTEICNNGIDDNGDGAVDCDDRTCTDEASCANLRCRPDKALGVLPLDGTSLSTALQTADAGDDQRRSPCVSAAGGQDAVVSFELPGPTDLTVEWAQVGNHALVLYQADPLPLPCEAHTLVDCHATANTTTGSFLLGQLAAGKYYMVVDADAAGTDGGVILQISGKPAAP